MQGLFQYEDSLDSEPCSIDSLDRAQDTECFTDSLDEESLSDSLDESDTEFYSLVQYTVYKDQVNTHNRGKECLQQSYSLCNLSHVGCQHILLKDHLSQSLVTRWECANVLDFLIFFGEKTKIQVVKNY